MGWKCEVIKDSINPSGDRLTTFVTSYPRMVHSEIMTHRSLAKSSASSRAIPIQKMIAQVYHDPAGPIFWGKNQSGMRAAEELQGWQRKVVTWLFYKARLLAIAVAWLLWKLGLHKQISNRLLEPWMWITVIMTGTEWSNLFALRTHAAAQPEFQHLAKRMRRAYAESIPKALRVGEWHLPFVTDEEVASSRDLTRPSNHYASGYVPDWAKLCRLSVGRSCRVSYLTHDGKRDPEADLKLADTVAGNGHFGALDHTAKALPDSTRDGHLVGWKPYRKTIAGEFDFGITGAVAKVQAHSMMRTLAAEQLQQPFLVVSKRPCSKWADEVRGVRLLGGDAARTVTADLFYVVAALDLDSSVDATLFFVPVAGLPSDMEPEIEVRRGTIRDYTEFVEIA